MKHTTHCHDLEGIVLKKTAGLYRVWNGSSALNCRLQLQPSARAKHSRRGDPAEEIVVGDRVQVKIQPDGSGIILAMLERRNRLARRGAVPMPGAHPFEQVIAANVDQVAAVMALSQPAPRWNLLDRYLTSAESLGIEALICLTKVDAARGADGRLNETVLEEAELYRQVGYRVIFTSVITGEGLGELKAALGGRVSTLLGKSGAGKSSLLNALLPGLGLRVGELNQVGKGRHTTTGVEMHRCDFEGWLVDTPGTREFGLWDVDADDLAWYFPEMRGLVGQCRFGLDCAHDEEPGCAIRAAVTAGQISPRRYMSMMKLKEEGYFQW